MVKAALHFITSVRIMFSYAPENIGPARDSQNHFTEEHPMCLLKDFCPPFSVTPEQAMRGAQHIVIALSSP